MKPPPFPNRYMSIWANCGFLVLRLGIAAMLITNHGWAKFTGAMGYVLGGKDWGFVGFVGSMGFPVPTVFALCAALAEFVGCLLLVAGLFTRSKIKAVSESDGAAA